MQIEIEVSESVSVFVNIILYVSVKQLSGYL